MTPYPLSTYVNCNALDAGISSALIAYMYPGLYRIGCWWNHYRVIDAVFKVEVSFASVRVSMKAESRGLVIK